MNLKLVSLSEPAATAAAEPTGEYRYSAFLSYSHHDKAIAKRLQKQLETYRVPKRLVGRETSHGAVPSRVSPVFRDRDELHAGSDLKASVHEALSRSRWLIVVCTPDAARSPWVNREIIEFKKLHGERRVLALIARGEPFASDVAGREAEECFPPALRRALTADGKAEGEMLEPIAADMRKQGDGAHRATLKLLAGMLGVPFDDLVRRDSQRRVRLLGALAASSAVGVVVFALLAVMAIQARNEAQYQRQQAEGLIEFMLGDLRKKLEPVGRLEVLDSVGEKALGYYSGQDATTLDATALGHRARAMHLIGEIRDLRGQPGEALKAFEQAAKTTGQLLTKAPGDAKRVFEHAQSSYWVGYSAWAGGDSETAEKWWGEYLRLARKLTEIDGANPDWQAELAFAHMNLGVLLLGTGRSADGLRSLLSAKDLFESLVKVRSGLRLELANLYGWLSMTRAQLGDYERALSEQQKRLTELRSVHAVEKNRGAQRGVLESLTTLSLYQLALGEVAEAETSIRDGLVVGAELLDVDPTNAFWRSDLCVALLRRVEIYRAKGESAEARAALAKAQRCSDELDAAGSQGPWVSMRIKARLMTYAILLDAVRPGVTSADALQFVDRSVPQLTHSGFDRAGLTVDLANLVIAVSRSQPEETSRADSAPLRRVEQLLGAFPGTPDGSILVPLAWAKYYLGKESEASALADRVRVSSYRHPDYVGLVKQLRAVQGGRRSNVSIGAKK